MKRIVTTLCALAVIMVGSIPAMAAEEPPRQDASYYPISVDEYTYKGNWRNLGSTRSTSCPFRMTPASSPPRTLSGTAYGSLCWT